MRSLEQYNVSVKECIGLPNMLANLQVEAAADFARYSEMYAEYEIKRAAFSDKTKYALEKPLSDGAVENKWLLEEDGKKWMFVKHYLSGLKMIIKAIDSATYTANMEAKSQI